MTTHHTDEKKPAIAGDGVASCELAMDGNGRFYIEPSTSDGEAVLRKMFAEGIAVAVTPSKPHAAIGAAEAME